MKPTDTTHDELRLTIGALADENAQLKSDLHAVKTHLAQLRYEHTSFSEQLDAASAERDAALLAHDEMLRERDAALDERDALRAEVAKLRDLLVTQTQLVNNLGVALTPEHVAECINSLVQFQHDVRAALKVGAP